ncbi:MAG: hypothetical protein ACLUFV_09240 [Acutalibacteraceae bacterium]
MTREEVDRYINQIALSGALDFISRVRKRGRRVRRASSAISGSAYSVFMVSDRVEMKTRSYTGEAAVAWSCDESGRYEMNEGKNVARDRAGSPRHRGRAGLSGHRTLPHDSGKMRLYAVPHLSLGRRRTRAGQRYRTALAEERLRPDGRAVRRVL